MNLPRSVLLLLLLCSAFAPLHAQSRDLDRLWEYAVWSGANFTNGHVVGFTQDRRLAEAGFTWAPVLTNGRHFTVRYRVDAIPFALLHDRRYAPRGQTPPDVKEWIYGGGISPVGTQLDFHNRSRRFTPFGEVTGGFLYWQRKVLGYRETQFQFTVGPGAGLRIALSSRTAVEFGYRYLHMSNANLYRNNPGLDAQMLYTGLCFFRRR